MLRCHQAAAFRKAFVSGQTGLLQEEALLCGDLSGSLVL